MTPQASTPGNAQERLFVLGEWILVLGLVVTLAWTTLCLGGYLAATMVTTSWAVFGLAAWGGLLWALGRGNAPLVFNRATLLPLPFLILALASVLWLAPARWLAWREWLLWLQMWLVFALALHFGRNRAHTWAIVGTFAALGVAGAAMATYQRFEAPAWLMLGRTQATQFSGRSSGMFGIPNSLAGLFELMVPVCLALLFCRATAVTAKVVCAWLAGLFLFAVVLTGSRGGWIALGLALSLWPLLGGRAWRRRLGGAAIVLGLACAGLWALYRFSDNAHGRIQPFLEGKFESSRPLIWKAGWQIWRDSPWLGGGAAAYNVRFEQYRPLGFLNEPQWAHNDYLNTLSDYGVIGFGLWIAGGGGLLWLGWKAVRRARREAGSAAGLFELWQWRLGLFVGLLAFAFHLGVDFHTKIPALAFGAAIAMAFLLRDEPRLGQPVPAGWSRGTGAMVMVASLLIAARMASPLYRAEALRYDSRRAIDRRAAAGRGDLREIVQKARANFASAVQVYPDNGQAWADLAYAIMQSWHLGGGDLVALGREAAPAADRALALCPINAEFWVRKGVALDMQARPSEGDRCFRRAVELAPNTPTWWYYYAYHLKHSLNRPNAALQAVGTCLALDPSNSAGLALRQQLVAKH